MACMGDRVGLDRDPLAALFEAVAPALTSGPAPEFGSVAWLALPVGHPARQAALVRAAMAWWSGSGRVFGPGLAPDHAIAAASKAVQAADPQLWRDLAGRRFQDGVAVAERRRRERQAARRGRGSVA